MNGNFIEANFLVAAEQHFLSDLLMDGLASIGFDSFDANENGFCAYIPEHLFDEQAMIDALTNGKNGYPTAADVITATENVANPFFRQ